MAAWALDEILKLLHPFMPFITEELWAVTAEQGPKRHLLALSDWPKLEGLADDKAEAEIGWLIELITAIRSIRAEMNITVAIPLVLAGASAGDAGARRTLGRIHQAAGARVGDFVRRRRAAGLGATRGARRGGGAAADRRHRSRRRARAAGQGNGEGRRRHRPRRRQAQQRQFRRARAGRSGRGRKRKTRGGGRPQRKIAEALERLKGAV